MALFPAVTYPWFHPASFEVRVILEVVCSMQLLADPCPRKVKLLE